MKSILKPKKLYPRPNYSQAILVKPGRLLFIAGQTAVDEHGNIVGKGDRFSGIAGLIEGDRGDGGESPRSGRRA